MILFELTGSEDSPAYQALEASNGARQYHFIHSIVEAALEMGRLFLSTQIIKALNYHALACLHVNAGEYRPCSVEVGEYKPPAHWKVQPLMDDFVNSVNRYWKEQEHDPILMAAFVLWQLNAIHPFINGNGRTARAACYYVLCVYAGGPLPGKVILPELLRGNRDEYVEALRIADERHANGNETPVCLEQLHQLLSRLVQEQLDTHNSTDEPPPNDEENS